MVRPSTWALQGALAMPPPYWTCADQAISPGLLWTELQEEAEGYEQPGRLAAIFSALTMSFAWSKPSIEAGVQRHQAAFAEGHLVLETINTDKRLVLIEQCDDASFGELCMVLEPGEEGDRERSGLPALHDEAPSPTGPGFCYPGMVSALQMLLRTELEPRLYEYYAQALDYLWHCGNQAFCHGDLWESFGWGSAYAALAWLTLPSETRPPLYAYTPPDLPEHSPRPAVVSAPPVTGGAPPGLRVAIVSSHIYVVDVALLLRELGASVSDWYGYRNPSGMLGGPQLDEDLGLSYVSHAIDGILQELKAPGISQRHQAVPVTVGLPGEEVPIELPRLHAAVAELVATLDGEGYDGLVCGYPNILCVLLARLTRTPVITVLAGLTSEYTTQALQPWVWAEIPLMRGEVVTYSHFLQRHTKLAAGTAVERIHHGARYVPRYGPPGDTADLPVLVTKLTIAFQLSFATGVMRALLDVAASARVKVRFIMDGFHYSHLAGHGAIVFFPWSWETTSFHEYYAYGMPLFLPSPRLLGPIIARLARIRGATRFVELRPEYNPPTLLGASPVETAMRWWPYTDYANFPHVQLFTTLGELFEKLRGDLEPIRAGMAAFNAIGHAHTGAWALAVMRTWAPA